MARLWPPRGYAILGPMTTRGIAFVVLSAALLMSCCLDVGAESTSPGSGSAGWGTTTGSGATTSSTGRPRLGTSAGRLLRGLLRAVLCVRSVRRTLQMRRHTLQQRPLRCQLRDLPTGLPHRRRHRRSTPHVRPPIQTTRCHPLEARTPWFYLRRWLGRLTPSNSMRFAERCPGSFTPFRPCHLASISIHKGDRRRGGANHAHSGRAVRIFEIEVQDARGAVAFQNFLDPDRRGGTLARLTVPKG